MTVSDPHIPPTDSPTDSLSPDHRASDDASADAKMRTHYDREWMGSLLRPFLIATLCACITVAIMSVLQLTFIGVPASYTASATILGIGAALLGCASTTWLAQPNQRLRRRTGLRAAEIGLLLLLTRIAVWITAGTMPPLGLLLTQPMISVLDGPFIIGAFVVVVSWVMATMMTGDLLKMALNPDELYAAEHRSGRSTDDPVPPNFTDRRAVLNGFVVRWVTGGVLLVLLAGGARIERETGGFFAITNQNIDPMVIAAVVIYFLCGLILISTGQLAVLRSRWTLEKVANLPSVLRNWPTYTTLLLLGVAAAATLLPFGGTFYLARILSTIITWSYIFLQAIFQLLLAIPLLILSLFMDETPPPPAETEAVPPPMVTPDLPPPASQMPEWFGGAVFWVILALLLGYAAYIYFSGRGVRFAWFRQFWALLVARWRELWGSYQMWQAGRVINRKEDAEIKGKSLFERMLSRLRLGNLTPEQQVRYFYITTIQSAKDAGLPRRDSETPNQFANRLPSTLAARRKRELAARYESDHGESAEQKEGPTSVEIEAEHQQLQAQEAAESEAIQQLTDAFVKVRYAGQSTKVEQIPGLKRFWERLRNWLNL